MFKRCKLTIQITTREEKQNSEFNFEYIPSRFNKFLRNGTFFPCRQRNQWLRGEDEKISRKTAIWGNLWVREHSGILPPYFGRIAGRRDSPQNPSVIEREIQEEDSNRVGRTYRRGITMKRDNSNGIIFRIVVLPLAIQSSTRPNLKCVLSIFRDRPRPSRLGSSLNRWHVARC